MVVMGIRTYREELTLDEGLLSVMKKVEKWINTDWSKLASGDAKRESHA